MMYAKICKASYVPLILKSMIFIFLAIISYIFYFTDVINKFAEKDTTLIYSQETVEDHEIHPLFITFFTKPRAKCGTKDHHQGNASERSNLGLAPNSIIKSIWPKAFQSKCF